MTLSKVRLKRSGAAFIGFLLFPLLALNAKASDSRMGWYVAAQYGKATSSSADLDVLNAVSGTVMSAQLGRYLSERFALEGMFRSSNFKDASALYLSNAAGTVTLNSHLKATVAGVGIREFLLTYFNLNLGFDYRSVDPGVTTTSNIAALNLSTAAKTTGFGYYAGVGVQIPFGATDLMADYTLNKFAANVYSNEITGGLRLHL